MSFLETASVLHFRASLLSRFTPKYLCYSTTSTSSPRIETVFVLLLVLLKSKIICFVCIQDGVIVLTLCHKVIDHFPVVSLLPISDTLSNYRVISVFLELTGLEVLGV